MKRIFVDVDVQRDFCEPAGALCVPESPNDAFRELTQYAVRHGIPILGSVDSHAFDAWEFASNDNHGPNGENPCFPDHCVKGTEGWLKVAGTLPGRFRFVANVAGQQTDRLVRELLEGANQALYFEKEVYSFFANPVAEPVVDQLREALGLEATWVVYGVATDYCVKSAALGLARSGCQTTLVQDATAGITEDGVAQALDEMRAVGVTFTTLDGVMGE